MREILFRGKRVDNGEWIYGVPITDKATGDAYIITSTAGAYLRSEINNMCATGFRAIPETVGQYTGLTDKNGTRIFEGDVVKLFDIAIGEIVYGCGTFGISCRQQIDYDYLASEIASITGCDNTPMFCHNDNFVSLWELYSNYNEENSEISVIEVIGTIYDNPELLKGEQKNETTT